MAKACQGAQLLQAFALAVALHDRTAVQQHPLVLRFFRSATECSCKQALSRLQLNYYLTNMQHLCSILQLGSHFLLHGLIQRQADAGWSSPEWGA